MTQTAARVIPGSRASWWLAIGALLAIIAPAALRGTVLLLYNVLLALLCAWDHQRIERAQLIVSREPPARLRARTKSDVPITLAQRTGPRLRLVLEQTCSDNVVLEPARIQATSRRGDVQRFSTQMSAHQHGRAELLDIVIKKESRLGLVARIEPFALPHKVRIYPDLPLGRSTLLSMERADLGSAPQRMLSAGHGSELASLREYVPSDPLRSIDWKATAKRLRPITRAYQPERSQTVWIIIDASRAMTLPLESDVQGAHGDEPTRFEAALRAALELADAALTSGDRVGLLVYGRTTLLSVAPKPGRAQLLHMTEQLLSVQPQATELDAQGLIRELSTRAQKRSLLMLFSDLDNEGDLRALAEHVRLLTRRHLAACMTLPSTRLPKIAALPLDDDEAVYRRVAALSLLEQRRRLSRALSDRGLPVLESAAPQLAQSALRRYREIKLSGRL